MQKPCSERKETKTMLSEHEKRQLMMGLQGGWGRDHGFQKALSEVESLASWLMARQGERKAP